MDFCKLYKIKNSQDPFNFQKIRNIKNTTKSAYNCAGYALNTFSWYCPSSGDNSNRNRRKLIKTMLKEFSDLRIIKSIKDLQSDEYAIAFRTGKYDLHYIKRASNGHWFHKMGWESKIRTMKEKEVFGKEWMNGNYNSKITLFAKKRI